MYFSRITLNKIAFPVLLFLVVLFLSMFKVHGSSMGAYNLILYGWDYKDPNLIAGQPRGIRSDEFLTLTPWTLSQVRDGFKTHNDLYLAGQEFSITDAPVKTWSAVFEPQNWAFFILPLQPAFAFKWWFKSFLLAVAVYFLSMRLTENQVLVSAISALAFVFSPYIQWWYSSTTSVTETVSFSIFTFLFFVRLVDGLDRPLLRWLNASIFIYFAICFLLTLYPPFQVPLAILFAFLGAGYLLLKRQDLDNANWRALAITMSLCLLAIGIILALYYISNESAIRALANTVYPGTRQESFGGDGWRNGLFFKAVAGFYNVQLLNDAHSVPDVLINQSFAASFFFFSLFLLPFYIFIWIRAGVGRGSLDFLPMFSIFSLVLFCIWTAIGLPPVLTKLLFLNYVPTNRVLLALGVINHVLIVYYVSRLSIKKTLAYRIVAGLTSFAVFLIVWFMGKYLQSHWPVYLNSELRIFLIACATGIMMMLLLYQKKMAFLSSFLIFSLASTFLVNPLYLGLSPLRDDKIVDAIQTIKEKDPQAGWVVYAGPYWTDYLAGNGVRTLNGTYYSPNLDFWSRFDPQHKYVNTYNRFMHLTVSPSTDPESIEFTLLYDDAAQLKISPCNSILREVGVKYHLFDSPQPGYSCLSPIRTVKYPALTLYLYERTD